MKWPSHIKSASLTPAGWMQAWAGVWLWVMLPNGFDWKAQLTQTNYLDEKKCLYSANGTLATVDRKVCWWKKKQKNNSCSNGRLSGFHRKLSLNNAEAFITGALSVLFKQTQIFFNDTWIQMLKAHVQMQMHLCIFPVLDCNHRESDDEEAPPICTWSNCLSIISHDLDTHRFSIRG